MTWQWKDYSQHIPAVNYKTEEICGRPARLQQMTYAKTGNEDDNSEKTSYRIDRSLMLIYVFKTLCSMDLGFIVFLNVQSYSRGL